MQARRAIGHFVSFITALMCVVSLGLVWWQKTTQAVQVSVTGMCFASALNEWIRWWPMTQWSSGTTKPTPSSPPTTQQWERYGVCMAKCNSNPTVENPTVEFCEQSCSTTHLSWQDGQIYHPGTCMLATMQSRLCSMHEGDVPTQVQKAAMKAMKFNSTQVTQTQASDWREYAACYKTKLRDLGQHNVEILKQRFAREDSQEGKDSTECGCVLRGSEATYPVTTKLQPCQKNDYWGFCKPNEPEGTPKSMWKMRFNDLEGQPAVQQKKYNAKLSCLSQANITQCDLSIMNAQLCTTNDNHNEGDNLSPLQNAAATALGTEFYN